MTRCNDSMVLQGAVNTSLETLQLLASGSTNISRLKKQQQEQGGSDASEEKDRQDTVSHQVRGSWTFRCVSRRQAGRTLIVLAGGEVAPVSRLSKEGDGAGWVACGENGGTYFLLFDE